MPDADAEETGKTFDLRFVKILNAGKEHPQLVAQPISGGAEAKYSIPSTLAMTVTKSFKFAAGTLIEVSGAHFDGGSPTVTDIKASSRESFTFVVSGAGEDKGNSGDCYELSGEVVGEHPRAGSAILRIVDPAGIDHLKDLFDNVSRIPGMKGSSLTLEIDGAREAEQGVFTVMAAQPARV